jgi:uncharacterized protein YqhQ
MALRDGVLLLSRDNWAVAVRSPDGSVEVRSGARSRLPGQAAVDRVPVLRGLGRLVEMTATLPAMRRELGRPVLPQEEPAVLWAAVASATATLLLRRFLKRAPLARELVVSALSIGPALIAVRATDLSRFHGAEHKSVAAYETGGSAASAAREHDRCGTNLIGPLLLTNMAGGLVLHATGTDEQPLPSLLVGLASLGSAFEIFSWMTRHRGNRVADALRAPGLILQRLLTTREPDHDQLEVAQSALTELLRREGAAPQAA